MIGIIDDQLRPYPKPLMGFGGHNIMPKKVITLPLILEVEPQMTMIMIEFRVIDTLSAYNILLGCLS